MDREYVIVCNRHSGIVPCALLFWGYFTKDDSKRSFSGYTSDLDQCERYTLEEVRQGGYKFPVYDERMTLRSFNEHDDVIIKISQLSELGFVTKRLVINP